MIRQLFRRVVAAVVGSPPRPAKDHAWSHVVRFFHKGRKLPPELPTVHVQQLKAMREIYVRGLWAVAGVSRDAWEAVGITEPRLAAELDRCHITPEQLRQPIPESLRTRLLLRGRHVGHDLAKALMREELDVDELVDYGLLIPTTPLQEVQSKEAQLIIPLPFGGRER